MVQDPALQGFLEARSEAVLVRVERATGSAPREPGAWMLVAETDLYGTIGGGRLEQDAILAARAMLAAGEAARRIEVTLGPETGQCCGGRVGLALARLDGPLRAELVRDSAAEHAARPHVLILGAGHVGRALAGLMAQMPVRTILIDSRTAELDRAPHGVEARLTAIPEAEIRAAPPGSAFAVMTHDHALDFLLAAEALGRGDAAYVGLIGSATKRARFLRFLAAREDAPSAAGLVCPVGAQGLGDKRPGVIAAFAAAEMLDAVLRNAKARVSARPGPLPVSG